MALAYVNGLNRVTGVATVALAPVRNAFLILVKLNIRKLAVNLGVIREKNRGALISMWQNRFGGSITDLEKNILQGAKVADWAEFRQKYADELNPKTQQQLICDKFYFEFNKALAGMGVNSSTATENQLQTAIQTATKNSNGNVQLCPITSGRRRDESNNPNVTTSNLNNVPINQEGVRRPRIGEPATTAAAALITAAPIVLASIELIRSFIKSPETDELAKDLQKEKPNLEKLLQNNSLPQLPNVNTINTNSGGSSLFNNIPKPILIGSGLLAAYFILK